MERIYVIEDDDNIRNLIRIAMEGFGYQVNAFETAEEALDQIELDKPDLAVFDLMLPGMDGLTAIKKIRQSENLKEMPIIIVTAKDKEFDKVVGLDVGADDYITKPFGVLELAARIRSLLRRSGKQKNSGEAVESGMISINRQTREVYCNGGKRELTLKEFELLLYLMENQTKVVTRDELLNHIWGYDYDGETRTLDMHIRTLRQKLGEEGGASIKTIRGVGYRFVKQGEA